MTDQNLCTTESHRTGDWGAWCVVCHKPVGTKPKPADPDDATIEEAKGLKVELLARIAIDALCDIATRRGEEGKALRTCVKCGMAWDANRRVCDPCHDGLEQEADRAALQFKVCMKLKAHAWERVERVEKERDALAEENKKLRAEIDRDDERCFQLTRALTERAEKAEAENQQLRGALVGMLDQPEDAVSYDAMMERARAALAEENREMKTAAGHTISHLAEENRKLREACIAINNHLLTTFPPYEQGKSPWDLVRAALSGGTE